MPIQRAIFPLLRGAYRAGASKVDDVLRGTPVGNFLRQAKTRTGNVLQQQFNPASRQASVAQGRKLGRKGRIRTDNVVDVDTYFNNPMRGKVGTLNSGVMANPAMRNIVGGVSGAVGLGFLTDPSVQRSLKGLPQNIEGTVNNVAPALDALAGRIPFAKELNAFGRAQEQAPTMLESLYGIPIPGGGTTVTPGENRLNTVRRTNDALKSYEDMTPLERRELYGGSGDMDAGPDKQERAIAKNERRRLKTEAAEEQALKESAPAPSPDNPVQTGVVPPRNTNMPASPEQSYMDPYAYNLAVYGQGRNAAQSQTEMDAVRDLGLAINKALYPQFNNTKNPTPPLQNMIPESYPQSADGLIEQRGVNLPGSMTNADAQSELLQGSTADDPYQIAARTKVAEALLEQAQIEALRRRFNVNQ